MHIRFILLSIFISSFFACQQPVKEAIVSKTKLVNKKKDAAKLATTTTKSNWLQPPYKHWGIKNVDQLFDIGRIAKGEKSIAFEKDLWTFNDLKIEQFDGNFYEYEEHLDSNRTDGFLVLHKGKIISEKYFGNMTESTVHNLSLIHI